MLAAPVSAFAELVMLVSGDTQYEYNSNVFDLQRGFLTPFGGTNLGDSDIAYGGKLDASYLLSQQQFYLTVQGNEYHYNRFTELDHSDFTFDAGWDWRFGRLWDGVFDVTRIRSMVSFWNVVGTSLVIQTEQRETARVGLQFTPDWRTELTGLTRKIDQPQLAAPDLSLTESSGEGAIKYTGTAGVTAGVAATYLKGDFSDVAPGIFAPSYRQTSGALTATDQITDKSTFRGLIGYTRRTSDTGFNNISGVTGELDYKRQLTGKTSAEIDLTRAINAYLTNDASEIDSIAALNVNWQATYKIGVVLAYSYTYRQLPGQGAVLLAGAVVTNGTERTDKLNTVGLTVTYDPVPWLVLKPYVNYQTRSAENFAGGDFNSTIVGIQFALQWQRGVIPQRTPLYQ
ncbi:MAG TPA: hypothetical protein VGL28_07690 [Steroidobacteraceae bacterium]|jgi:hypothetical protein